MSAAWTVHNHGAPLEARALKAAMAAVKDAAEHLAEKQKETMPHDTYAMEHSTHVPDVVRSGSRLTSGVTVNTPYAVKQHEDTSLRHRPGERARWLELTAAEQTAAITARLKRALENP